MENELSIVYTEGKIFVGKIMISTPEGGTECVSHLKDCIECLPMLSGDGRYMIIGNVIGTLSIPNNALTAILSKDSNYYKNYMQVTTGVEVVQPSPEAWTKRRIN